MELNIKKKLRNNLGFLVSFIGITINMRVLYIFIEFFHFDMVLSKLIANSCVFFGTT